MTLRERWEAKVDRQESGCWLWTGYVSKDGYGHVGLGGHGVVGRAHRVAYELHVGPIPEGLQIDHLCRNRACVNPDHLEAVTSRENTLRGNAPAARCAQQTHCIHGHPFDDENTYVDPQGHRQCRQCSRDRKRRWWARHHGTSCAALSFQTANGYY